MLELLIAKGTKKIPIPNGQSLLSGFSGTSTFTVPANVTGISAVTIGGGNQGTGATLAAGRGGDLRWIKNFPVTPGEKLTITLTSSGLSSIKRANSTVILLARGGLDQGIPSTTINLTLGIGGGDGGAAGVSAGNVSGGGGAGGYAGNGGTGYPTSSQLPAANSGAASGGQLLFDGSTFFGLAGGGVGPNGQGTTAANPGDGGSGGGGNASFVTGNPYGSGGGTRLTSSNGKDGYSGGGGCVRLIWGDGRFYPSTNTANMT